MNKLTKNSQEWIEYFANMQPVRTGQLLPSRLTKDKNRVSSEAINEIITMCKEVQEIMIDCTKGNPETPQTPDLSEAIEFLTDESNECENKVDPGTINYDMWMRRSNIIKEAIAILERAQTSHPIQTSSTK